MGIGTNQREILQHFKLEGGIADVTNHGSGHINHTFLVTTDGEKRYILQRINKVSASGCVCPLSQP